MGVSGWGSEDEDPASSKDLRQFEVVERAAAPDLHVGAHIINGLSDVCLAMSEEHGKGDTRDLLRSADVLQGAAGTLPIFFHAQWCVV